MAEKLYCYVDESGQDTQGQLFIVAVVVLGHDRDLLRRICLDIEADSRKGSRKWAKSNQTRRLAYVEGILARSEFRGKLYFGISHSTKDYLTATAHTISGALGLAALGEFRATVLVDGLPRTIERDVALMLRRSGLPVRKVRGMDDRNEPLIRLADALCGLVRGAGEGNMAMTALLNRALTSGWVIEL